MHTIAFAYSGGRDTSMVVPWLRERHDARVVGVAADLGQREDEWRGVRGKSLASGAGECDKDRARAGQPEQEGAKDTSLVFA